MCLTRGECADASSEAGVAEYAEANGLDEDDSIYVVCTEAGATTSAVTSEGETLPAVAHEEGGVGGAFGSFGQGVVDQEGTEVESSEAPGSMRPADCDIATPYMTECYFGFTYQKWRTVNGRAQKVWERGIDGYAKINLQQISSSVYMRFTSREGLRVSVGGEVELLRMQGWGEPGREDFEPFWFKRTHVQPSGTAWVTRSDKKEEGKYSVKLSVDYIEDSSEGKVIRTLGSYSIPRFQCYPENDKRNCEWPNGREAGVF